MVAARGSSALTRTQANIRRKLDLPIPRNLIKENGKPGEAWAPQSTLLTSTGHGWVAPNKNPRLKANCGGPGLCPHCDWEQAEAVAGKQA